ncbi:MAG: four helix bundle protein [Anaerolineales bacterium]|jgi:four helix bundle protein
MMIAEFRPAMNADILKKRTKQFGLEIIKLVEKLPNTQTSRIIGNRHIRSGTSMGANYRAACRSRSKAEFIAKLGTVIEEADESAYWLELLIETGIVRQDTLEALMKEADELIAIMIASVKTAKNRK